MGKELVFIFGAIAGGIAIAVSLFVLYPDMMFQGTSLESQGGMTTTAEEPVFIDPANTGGNSTNSTTNATTGAPATTAPPY